MKEHESYLTSARQLPILELERDQDRLVAEMRSREIVSPDNAFYKTAPHNPDKFREVLGGILPYFRDVEYQTSVYAAELDAGLGPDEFRSQWLREEVPHGLTIDQILQETGINEPLPVMTPPGMKFVAIGSLRSKIPLAGDLLGLISSKVGHINEAMNIKGQIRIMQTCKEISEQAIARTFGAMTRQERTHDRWYMNDIAIRENRLYQRNRGWLITLADQIASRQFPVGANSDQMKKRFGEVVMHLADGKLDEFLDEARKVIHETYSRNLSSAKTQVNNTRRMLSAYETCVSMFEKA